MNKNAPYTLNIDMSLSKDMDTCTCRCATSVGSETVLAALIASAVVAIAHDHICDPYKFADATCATIMEFIDKPGFIKPKGQLS